jgi:hypothetical protein
MWLDRRGLVLMRQGLVILVLLRRRGGLPVLRGCRWVILILLRRRGLLANVRAGLPGHWWLALGRVGRKFGVWLGHGVPFG